MRFQTRLFIQYSLLLAVIMTTGCSKPSELGLTLVEQEQSSILFTDSIGLTLQTVTTPTQNTLNEVRLLIGEYDDPIFGKTTSSAYLNFSLPSTNVSFPNTTYDSLVLSLEFDTTGHYGEVLSNPTNQTWEVYRMESSIEINTDYNSDATFSTGQLLGSGFSFYPNYSDSIQIEEDGSSKLRAAQLRIRLDDNFGQELLNPTDPNIYSSNENFKNFFKGLLIQPVANANNNSLLRFRSSSNDIYTRLTLYYSETETDSNGVVNSVPKTYVYSSASDAESVIGIQHDYTTSNILDNNTTDTIVYVQGADGVGVSIDFSSLLDLGSISVNKAELYVYPVDGDTDEFPIPSQLVCKYELADGSLDFIDDIYTSFSRLGTYDLFGGILDKQDSNNNFYKMNISEYLQRVVNAETSNNKLYLQTVAVIDPSRVRLGNHNSTKYNSKLFLTYTKLQ
ncbi:MAG: DUF4270 domain-containing protein [Saprospiraceae bacterium]|nr:DUF4270 domain-containing protein [Saprospiraceae bacterium]